MLFEQAGTQGHLAGNCVTCKQQPAHLCWPTSSLHTCAAPHFSCRVVCMCLQGTPLIPMVTLVMAHGLSQDLFEKYKVGHCQAS